jgi:dipeptide/tripeptide permease
VDQASKSITEKRPASPLDKPDQMGIDNGGQSPTDAKSFPDTHPPAIWFFFWGEFAERSSYYGMRAILFLYMTTALRLSDTEAAPTYAAFKMGCYLLPLLGGLIADRWIGRYWTIVGFSVPYVLGHFILGFSDPAILGQVIQGMSSERVAFIARLLLFLSLLLLAGGSGVIKPNISSLLGQTYDQKRPGKERLRTSAFLWFYLAINVGALISQVGLPWIREWYISNHLPPEIKAQMDALIAGGKADEASKLIPAEVIGHAYQLAFAFPTVLMAISLGVFAAGKRTYADDRANRKELTAEERRQSLGTLIFIGGIYGLFVLYLLFEQLGLRYVGDWKKPAQAAAIGLTMLAVVTLIARSVLSAGRHTFEAETYNGRHLTPEQQHQRRRALFFLLAIIGLVIFFWFGYEHNDTLWVGFTRDYVDLRVPLVKAITGKELKLAPDQLQFLNALFVIILIPVFNITFKYLDPDVKVFTSMRKILVGFFLTAAAVGIMAGAGYMVQGHAIMVEAKGTMTEVFPEEYKLSIMWPAIAYIVLTFGEVLLYGTMLDLSYGAAPKSMKGYVTACFLLTNALANFLNILWTPYYGGSLGDPMDKRGPLPPGRFFAITAGVTAIAALLFVLVGKRFEKAQKAAENAA